MTEEIKDVVEKNEIDTDLVEKAFQDLSDIFSSHFENAMMDAGNYLVKAFYDNDIELARKKESPKEESLNQLIKRLQNRSSNAPSKSWIYQSIGLIIQSHDMEQEENSFFQTYGKLSLSHKVCLLPVTDIEVKKDLIDQVVEKELSVRGLETLKAELRPSTTKQAGLLTLLNKPEDLKKKTELLGFDSLEQLPFKKLTLIKEKTTQKREEFKAEVKKHQSYLEQYDQLLEEINKALEGKEPGKVGRPKSSKS